MSLLSTFVIPLRYIFNKRNKLLSAQLADVFFNVACFNLKDTWCLLCSWPCNTYSYTNTIRIPISATILPKRGNTVSNKLWTTNPTQSKTCKASIHEACAVFHILCHDKTEQCKTFWNSLTFYFIQFGWQKNVYVNNSVKMRSQF